MRGRWQGVAVAIWVSAVVLARPPAGAGAASSRPTPTTIEPAVRRQGTPFIAGTVDRPRDRRLRAVRVPLRRHRDRVHQRDAAHQRRQVDGQTCGTAPFTTRLLVYRPVDAKNFNGTVIVEWNNVSAGLDSAPIWLAAHDELDPRGLRVGGRHRAAGRGRGRRPGAVVPNLDLKHNDPARYGALVHPGDSYSYDMYRQAGVGGPWRRRPSPRWPEAEARDRGGRVAVRVPHDHLHRRDRTAQQGRVRRLLRVQPRRRRCRTVAGTGARREGYPHPR